MSKWFTYNCPHCGGAHAILGAPCLASVYKEYPFDEPDELPEDEDEEEWPWPIV